MQSIWRNSFSKIDFMIEALKRDQPPACKLTKVIILFFRLECQKCGSAFGESCGPCSAAVRIFPKPDDIRPEDRNHAKVTDLEPNTNFIIKVSQKQIKNKKRSNILIIWIESSLFNYQMLLEFFDFNHERVFFRIPGIIIFCHNFVDTQQIRDGFSSTQNSVPKIPILG